MNRLIQRSTWAFALFFFMTACSGGGGSGDTPSPSVQSKNWVSVETAHSLKGTAFLSGTSWVNTDYFSSYDGGIGLLLNTTRTTDYPGVDISITNLSTGQTGQARSSYGPGTQYKHKWSATVPVLVGPNIIQVSAFDPVGKGGTFTYTVIGGPVNVAVTPGSGQVAIRWDIVPGAVSYNVYWATNAGANRQSASKLAAVTSPFVHAGLTNGTTYYYVVTAVFAEGESDDSPLVHAIPGTLLIGGTVQGKPLVLSSAVSTFASGEGGTFSYPTAVTTDGTYLYLYGNGIWKIQINTRIVSKLSMTPVHHLTTDGINLYATTFSSIVQKIVIATGETTTLAGSEDSTGSADGVGSSARFLAPFGITTDGINLYVADSQNHTIRKVEISTGLVSTLAGSAGASGLADGVGSTARFSFPISIITDGNNLYAGDLGNGMIRQIVIATGEVTTLASGFNGPEGITTDGSNLYVTNQDNSVSKVVIATGEVTSLAGSAGSAGRVDGAGPDARFSGPMGITTDGIALFLADFQNGSIRKIQ